MAVAFPLLATGFELRAHPHQLGLRLAVLERFFALLEIVAETSQGKAFQDAIQEIADVQVGMLVGCLLVGGAADNRKENVWASKGRLLVFYDFVFTSV
jgi:hypothetical protein